MNIKALIRRNSKVNGKNVKNIKVIGFDESKGCLSIDHEKMIGYINDAFDVLISDETKSDPYFQHIRRCIDNEGTNGQYKYIAPENVDSVLQELQTEYERASKCYGCGAEKREQTCMDLIRAYKHIRYKTLNLVLEV